MNTVEAIVASILVLLMSLSYTLSSLTYIAQSETPVGEIYLKYKGEFALDINNPEAIEEYIDIENSTCTLPLSSVFISIYYDTEVYVNNTNGSLITSVLFTIKSVTTSPQCVKNSLGFADSQVIELEVNKLDGAPIMITIENKTIKPINPTITGDVVGIVRFEYDVIHRVKVETIEDAYRYYYSRVDAYYEPFTNTLVHFTETTTNRTARGIIYRYAYLTLEKSGENPLKAVNRKVFNLLVTEKGVNKTATLVVLYEGPESINSNNTPTALTYNDSIIIEFPENTTCFILIGVLKSGLNSNVVLSYYETEGGRVYYTPRPTMCRVINMNLTESQVMSVEEEEKYPEKNLPPYNSAWTSSDLVVATLVFSQVILDILLLSIIITRKLVK
jgi:hypothetical protein